VGTAILHRHPPPRGGTGGRGFHLRVRVGSGGQACPRGRRPERCPRHGRSGDHPPGARRRDRRRVDHRRRPLQSTRRCGHGADATYGWSSRVASRPRKAGSPFETAPTRSSRQVPRPCTGLRPSSRRLVTIVGPLPIQRIGRCPVGAPAEVAECLLPYVKAGCCSFTLVPVVASPDVAIAAVAEVRTGLLAMTGA
jgi:hypothetical protein